MTSSPTSYAPQRVLVTGADGLIGRATTALLLEQGIAVTALSPQFRVPSAADRSVAADARDEDAVTRALEGCDAVVHLGAIPHRDLAPPLTVYATNTDATFNVLSKAGASGVRNAVIASSINAFGVPMNHREMRPAYYPLDELTPARLDDWYSLSKASDELTASMCASHWDMSVLAIRFPFIGDPERFRHHVAANEADPSLGVREGWAYLDVRDAAQVVLDGLRHPVHGAEVILVAAEDTLLTADSADLLAAHAPGVPVRRPLRGNESLIDTTKAAELIGFAPRHSLHHTEGAVR